MIDAAIEAFPGQGGAADGQARGIVLDIDRRLDAAGQPADIDRPLRQAPGGGRHSHGQQHRQGQQQPAYAMQPATDPTDCLTGQASPGQPAMP